MARPPAKSGKTPRKRQPQLRGGPRPAPRPARDDDDDAPAPRSGGRGGRGGGSTWPYIVFMLLGWGVIFGGLFFSHFLSSLPDVSHLMVAGPSQDITLLDDRGRQIARRGLTQGQMVRAEDLPDYVSNAFIAIEDRRFRSH